MFGQIHILRKYLNHIFKNFLKKKDTDFYYLEKRNNTYNPTDRYDFETWRNRLDTQVQSIYENLHKELIYTDEQQSFNEALYTFEKINAILQSIKILKIFPELLKKL